MMPSRTIDLSFKPVLFLLSGRTLAFAATFFIPVILARIFSQDEFGTYKQLFLVWITIHAAAQFGIAESLFYFLPRDPRAAGAHVANSVLFLGASGLVCLGLLEVARGALAVWLSNPELSRYVSWLGLFVLLMLMSSVLENVLTARGRYFEASAAYGASDALRAACSILPVLVVPNLESVMIGAVVFASLRLVATLVYLGRVFGHELRPCIHLFGHQVAYAAPFAAAVFFDLFQLTFHQYTVSHRFDAATFAVYSVGCLQIPLIGFLYASVSNVMMVRMGEALRESHREALLIIWHDTTRRLALVLIPALGLLLVVARPLIVLLFTEAYSPSVPIFMVSSLGILLTVFNSDGVLRVHAETRFILLRNCMCALVVLVLIHAALAQLGLPGAVLVTIVAGVAGKVLDLARIRALLAVGFAEVAPWRTLAAIAGAAATAGGVSWAITAPIELPAVLTLALGAVLYATAYLALLLRFGLLTRSEQQAVINLLSPWRTGLMRTEALGPDARQSTR
jgi:O-antigen/teichoic acid export membrane protein